MCCRATAPLKPKDGLNGAPAEGDNPDYALFLPSLISGLQNLQQAYGSSLSINSGYRSPIVNQVVEIVNNETWHPNGPHIYGCAADISTGQIPDMKQTNWDDISAAAKTKPVSACVEP